MTVRYRTSCVRSRIIPLSPEFVEYLREDGIVLADDDEGDGAAGRGEGEEEWQTDSTSNPPAPRAWRQPDSDSDEEDAAEPPALPPNRRFPAIHQAIADQIRALGGAAAPKLNWSAPRDATWISPHQNTMKCTCPNDVYLLLKSSSFVSYDLEHAFDDCVVPSSATSTNNATNENK